MPPSVRALRPSRPARALLLAGAAAVAAAGVAGWRAQGEGGTAAAAAGSAPVVWVQAGHEAPGEPGYRAQTGAGGGPFGSEVAFNERLQAALVARLRADGVDARTTPGRVTPLGARGAVFISLHFDAAGGSAGIGAATSGRGENWYHGEGVGTASPRPYADSAPHRTALPVTPGVERVSRTLAQRIATRYRAVFTSANGARSRFRGVEPRGGNVRMTHFYGFFRTRATARVLVECGASGADDRFLSRTGLIAGAIADGIEDHLMARGALRSRR